MGNTQSKFVRSLVSGDRSLLALRAAAHAKGTEDYLPASRPIGALFMIGAWLHWRSQLTGQVPTGYDLPVQTAVC